jgi:hypothetical protein
MIDRRIVFLLLICWSMTGMAQNYRVISGTVRDATTGELLIGATVSDSISGTGIQTNTYGFFSLKLPIDVKKVKVSFVGYHTQDVLTDVETSTTIDVRLAPLQFLKEVIITEKRLLTRPAGSLSVSAQQIRSLPTLLGESDVLKALSFTPGVSTGTEGSAGLYVRGGTPDQNLILLDEAPVYNVNHLGGFFSVFNTNSLKTVDLYKGPFPARYGGRLASVVDLTMKDGNNQKFGGEVGVGLLNQNLTLEGPIIKNKASFIVSGRVSTLGFTNFLKKNRQRNNYGSDYIYKFYDLNAKVNYQLSKTDQVYISFYNGFDRFLYNDWSKSSGGGSETSVGNNWGNITGTIRYSKAISPKIFARAALIYSQYVSEFANEFGPMITAGPGAGRMYRNIDAGVKDLGGKFQVDYFQSSVFTVRAGMDVTRHVFNPFTVSTNYSGSEKNVENSQVRAFQTGVFVEGDINVLKQVTLNLGLRGNRYQVEGRNFSNVEPRVGVNWTFMRNWALKGGLSVMNQYLHLLTNNGYGFGYDAWLPSTSKVPPTKSIQWSAGFYRSIPKTDIDLSFEVYAKTYFGQIDYPDGTNFTGVLSRSWEEILTTGGIGRVKGLEVMASKTSGRFTGSVAYTLSKSERQFDSINNGAWYPIKYDRRHNLSMTAGYLFKQRWRFNSAFVYQTGHAVTVPDAAILPEAGGDPWYIYSRRNNGRMPTFHRLDIGATRFLTTRHNRKAELSVGLYNAYNRANPLYIDFKVVKSSTTYSPEKIIVKQYSLFPVLPYISYSLKF